MRYYPGATAIPPLICRLLRKIRSVERETRWRWRLKVLWTAACMPKNARQSEPT
jgi:hypothetical protein